MIIGVISKEENLFKLIDKEFYKEIKEGKYDFIYSDLLSEDIGYCDTFIIPSEEIKSLSPSKEAIIIYNSPLGKYPTKYSLVEPIDFKLLRVFLTKIEESIKKKTFSLPQGTITKNSTSEEALKKIKTKLRGKFSDIYKISKIIDNFSFKEEIAKNIKLISNEIISVTLGKEIEATAAFSLFKEKIILEVDEETEVLKNFDKISFFAKEYADYAEYINKKEGSLMKITLDFSPPLKGDIISL